jgi:general secretion pathway protein G
MKRLWGDRAGFTLVEILIVVIILGILAAVAIPQFTGSTDEARDVTLKANLTQMRNAIELYYHQHNNVYPGAKHFTDGSTTTTAAEAESSFVAQLTLYTDGSGVSSTSKTATYKYGPYMKVGIPENPYNELTSVLADLANTDLSLAASSGTAGWKFYVQTGRLIANDGAHDTY